MAYVAPNPTTNTNALTFQALNYFNNASNTYFVLGKTSPWGTSDVPTKPATTDTIQEVFGYLKPAVNICYQVTENQADDTTLQFGNLYLKPTNPDNAYSNQASYVYYQAELSSADFQSVNVFRQIGLSLGVQTNATSQAVDPTAIINPGKLQYLYNRYPLSLVTDETFIISSVVQIKSIEDANSTITTSATTSVSPTN